MKRTTWILLAVVGLLAGMYKPASAQASGPTIVVTVGFDGYCRAGNDGGWCAVYAEISNEGADVEGELRAVGGTGSSDVLPNVYARRVVLPAHSHKAYFLYLPSAEFAARSRLTVQLVAGGKVLVSEQAGVAWLDGGDRLYAVASSSPSALNFLSDVTPVGGMAVVAHLDAAALPPDPLGWEGLDVLILNDVDTTVLSSEQRRALETWVAHGGHLVVGGGAGAARTAAGIADLLPVTVGGVRPVDSLEALKEWGASVASGPYAVADVVLRDGEVYVEQQDGQGGLILLARRAYGTGTVSFLAFDAGLNPFTYQGDNARLWEFVAGVEGAGAPRFTVRDGYTARSAVGVVPGLEPPSMLQILLFMLVYTLLIGPLNYVVLRKLDRRELAWLTIPALVVGFTACAYVTGFQLRGGTAIVHRLAVVYVPEGTSVARVSEVLGLFSPRRTTYDVRVADAGAREIVGGDYGGSARHPLYVVEEAEGLQVTGLRVDVGGMQAFGADGYVDVPAIGSDLRLVADGSGRLQVEGTVRNGRVPLKGAVLIVGDVEQRLGDLEAGEEAHVSLLLYGGGGAGSSGSTVAPTPLPVSPPLPAPLYGAGVDMPQRILGAADYWSDRDLYRRYQFLQAIFAYAGPIGLGTASSGGGTGLGPGVHLLGWTGEVPLPVEVVGRPFSRNETALYVYDVPVAGAEAGVTVTVPPGVIERQVVETTGSVNMWPEGFHMEPGAGVVFRFHLWPEVAVRQADELALDLQGSSYGNVSHPPVVWLWNRENDDWERLDVGWGQFAIPNAGVYVLPPGAVLLRLETSAEWPADVENLTITIKGQR